MQPLRIYALTFVNKALTLSTDNRDDFWLEIPGGIGWVKFSRLREEKEFTNDGALFAATELRSVRGHSNDWHAPTTLPARPGKLKLKYQQLRTGISILMPVT